MRQHQDLGIRPQAGIAVQAEGPQLGAGLVLGEERLCHKEVLERLVPQSGHEDGQFLHWRQDHELRALGGQDKVVGLTGAALLDNQGGIPELVPATADRPRPRRDRRQLRPLTNHILHAPEQRLL